jgi:hypothetical protein
MKVIIEDQAGPELPFPPGFKPSSFSEATVVRTAAGSETTYTADIKRDWCIGLGT